MEKNGFTPIAARDEGADGVNGVSLAALRTWHNIEDYAYFVVEQGSITKTLRRMILVKVRVWRATYENSASIAFGLKYAIRRLLNFIKSCPITSTSPLPSGEGSAHITNRGLINMADILANCLSFLTAEVRGLRQMEVPLMA